MDRHHRKENPSFSSTLLDVISRSIDESDDQKSVGCRKSMRSRQSIDGWFQVDKQIADTVVIPRNGGSVNVNIADVVSQRKSATGFESSSGDSFYLDCSLGSSGCRYGGGISSSEGEMIYGFPARPRPIRTNISHDDEYNAQNHQSDDLQPKANCEGKFVKTKSRAMKIYGYLKKGKQPISPGGRLATFLFSLFSTTNTKKSKIPSPYNGGQDEAIVHANRKPKSSTSSSASSFSRSCLNKTPSSSRAKLTTDMKRSVRFYPANVIVNEYSQPIGHKSLTGDRSSPPAVKFARNSINGELKKHLTEKNRRIEETHINILKNYRRKVKYVFDSIKNNVPNNDDDDEAASYASSDLFELDHLSSAIGMDRCMQELPLYETTSVDVNRAIANGLLV